MKKDNVILSTSSHRARKNLDDALGRHPQYYYTWERGACFAEVTKEEYLTLPRIKGIARARVVLDDLRMCISYV